jgi:excinuclease UvrABC ATPase subunit
MFPKANILKLRYRYTVFTYMVNSLVIPQKPIYSHVTCLKLAVIVTQCHTQVNTKSTTNPIQHIKHIINIFPPNHQGLAINPCHHRIKYVIMLESYKTFKLVRRGWQGKAQRDYKNLLPARARGYFYVQENCNDPGRYRANAGQNRPRNH